MIVMDIKAHFVRGVNPFRERVEEQEQLMLLEKRLFLAHHPSIL